MTENTCYYSVGRDASDPARVAEIKVKRSVFICSLGFADSIQAAKAFISRVSKENKTATHNCWAYIVGETGEIRHSSDAGEPAGTAGKPMLNTLDSHGMTQVAAVVTRHYGGVKLGVRGLIQAYSDAVTEAVDQAPLVRLVQTRTLSVTVGYGFNDSFLNRIQEFEPDLLDSQYADRVTHTLAVAVDRADEAIALMDGFQRQGLLTMDLQEP